MKTTIETISQKLHPALLQDLIHLSEQSQLSIEETLSMVFEKSHYSLWSLQRMSLERLDSVLKSPDLQAELHRLIWKQSQAHRHTTELSA